MQSGLCAMALATSLASAAVAAPRMSRVTAWLTPSPSATIWRASERQTSPRAASKAGDEFAAEPHAAGAAGEQQHGVVGGGVAVDGDGVEAGFDRSSQRRLQFSASGRDIGEEIDQHGGVRRAGGRSQLGMDHSRALGRAPDAHLGGVAVRLRRIERTDGTTAHAVLMLVSVVMMARTKASACCSVLPIEAFNSGIAATTFSAGKGTPMIPVDEGKTSSKMQPKLSAAATQVVTQPSMPGSPLAQLALPELTSTAATRPPVAARCRRPTVTGAATTRLVVNMAAPTAAPASRTTAMARSRLPLALIPARTAPHWNPAGRADAVNSALSFIPLLYQAGGALRFRPMEKPHSRSATKWRILGLIQQEYIRQRRRE